MNKLSNIKKWAKAEVEFVNQFGGSTVSDMALQNKDIDVVFKCGATYSIKNQVGSSKKYGGITLEHRLEDPNTGETIKGNVQYCEADTYAWKVWYEGKEQWLLVHCKTLKQYAEDNSFRFGMKKLLQTTLKDNSSQGRKYTQSHIQAIPLTTLLSDLNSGEDYKLVPAQ